MQTKPPYPYFGGKLTVINDVWKCFGYTPNFVDPFFGGGSSLWMNPAFNWQTGQWSDNQKHLETVNDIDGMVSNFWRAIKWDAETVAKYADWPVNENDLHARHVWLVNQKDELQQRLEGAPDYFDAKVAGYWVWGICSWIGHGFASGKGPWQSIDGLLANVKNGNGVRRQRPHLGNNGVGINRQRPHLGNNGVGINRQLPHLNNGRGLADDWSDWLQLYFARLQDRLRQVRVCSGDWRRVLGPTPTEVNGLTAVFLDPPYAVEDRETVYNHDSYTVAHDVREWAIANGDNPMLRIALCGYDEHQMPDEWEMFNWSAHGGYETQSDDPSGNRHREVIWFSPHCLKVEKQKQMQLFGEG